HPAKRLVGRRALARGTLVALAVDPRGPLAGRRRPRRSRRGIGPRELRQRVVLRWTRRTLARGLAHRQLGLQGRALDMAQRLVIDDHQRREPREPGLRALEDARGDAHRDTVARLRWPPPWRPSTPCGDATVRGAGPP